MDLNQDFLFLCNFDEQFIDIDNNIIKKLWSGNWVIANDDLYKEIMATIDNIDSLRSILKKYIENNDTRDNILSIAISSILKFCYENWTSHKEKVQLDDFIELGMLNIQVLGLLQCDSEEICTNIIFPELLFISLQIFSALSSLEQNLLFLWWCFRCKVVHQKALEDASATLYSELEVLMAKLSNESQSLQDSPRIRTLLFIEMSQAYLLYGRVQKAEEYLVKAKSIVGLKLELIGVLGKRTRFQQDSLPQLALSSELESGAVRPPADESHGASDLPPQIELQDDVRLDRIQYNERIAQNELPSLEQTLCLLTVQYLQKARPRDSLIEEELLAYIEGILSQKHSAWSTRVATVLIKCKLEANNKRTIERAMLQCEVIKNDKPTDIIPTRLSYLWASGLQPSWCWWEQLADLYLSLGLVKAALEEYLKLQLWESVIVCYNILQLKHKAAEVIQQEINKKPTVKLLCLLGDTTDDVNCYEKAWEMSEFKSSRAQRHWGNYLFDRKQYDESIPHYEKSLEINSLQENVWLRLGYAALVTEQWDISATAYRRYTYLQPNSFEAWNNLAKVYVKQGDKERAYRALMESLKFNYDNWKLWENVIAVSMDTGHFGDVIRGCHRILDLQGKFDDLEVLSLLVRAIIQDKPDADGNSAARLQKRMQELFGRITSVYQNKPEIWQLYAEISPTCLLKGQRLLKTYRGFSQGGVWSNDPSLCNKVVDLAQALLEASLRCRQEEYENDKIQIDQLLSSARLTGQTVMRAAEKQNWPDVQPKIPKLQILCDSIMEYLSANKS